jgi:hypothetical protein
LFINFLESELEKLLSPGTIFQRKGLAGLGRALVSLDLTQTLPEDGMKQNAVSFLEAAFPESENMLFT